MNCVARFPPTDGESMTDSDACETPVETAAGIARGVSRLLLAHATVSIVELPLPDGRRADVVGLAADGTIIIVEIKSSIADFRSDQKWQSYRAYCDALYFAVAPAFPVDILPFDTGLILADRFGGDFAREAPVHPLASARRKAMTMRFARAGAARLTCFHDPQARLLDN
jgi:hypothetical protein